MEMETATEAASPQAESPESQRPTEMVLPTVEAIQTEKARRHLKQYLQYAWHLIEPSTPFVDGWHIDAICEYLEAITAGDIRKLLITVPPRHGKSGIISVFWPTWAWANDPALRWIFASYAADLSTRDAVRSRRIIESQWYQRRWGHQFKLTSDQNVKTRYENDKTGYRLTTSVGGAVTGEGGDVLVADDPHNIKRIYSQADRRSVIQWWDEVMSTRLNDPQTSARVIIMQRCHLEDLAGHLLKQGGYEHLDLQAEAETRTLVQMPVSGREIKRNIGDLLWPERFPKKVIDQQRIELGSYAFAAQMQQRPAPLGGGILRRKWWQFYTILPKITKRTVQSWDTGCKDREQHDPSACLTGVETDRGIYLVDLWWDRVQFPELVRAAKVQHNKHNPTAVIVEDKQSGISLIQSLRAETKIPVLAIDVDSDKVARASAVSPTVEAGNVYLPEDAPWVADFMDECDNFPNAPNDDRVDAFTQLVSYIMGFGKEEELTPQIRGL